jgi:hypothetical protein
MKLKFCSCRMCRYGRHRWGNRKMITHMKRSYRHKVKQSLHKFEYDNLPIAISIPYTD